MIIAILLLILSLGFIIFGANLLTDGSVALARRLGMSELVIGLSIVAIGTSMPELVVSVVSAINGNAEISLGNVIGSNIMNILVILGIVALVKPIPLTRENIRINIPMMLLVSALLCFMCSEIYGLNITAQGISRPEGALLLLGFIIFMCLTFKRGGESSEPEEHHQNISLFKTLAFIVLGLVMLVGGGKVFLGEAVELARLMGISEYVISVTIIAFGTSVPELAASLVAALKGRSQLAVGNVVGSNISNILLVLGSSSVIMPLSVKGISVLDISMLLISAGLLMLSPFVLKKHQIGRIEGTVMLIVYLSYIVYLLK